MTDFLTFVGKSVIMQIKINNTLTEVAESWNDLNLEQQIACYQIIMQDTDSEFLSHEVIELKRINLMQYLLGIDEDFLEEWEADCISVHGEEGWLVFSDELKQVATATTAFFFQEVTQKDAEGNETKAFTYALGLTNNPYPFFIIKKKASKAIRRRNKKNALKKYQDKKLFGPMNGLKNVSLYELATTFTLFENYLQTKDESIIDTLIATLYRPKKRPTEKNLESGYEGDFRLPYLKHESTVAQRVPTVQRFHVLAKALVVFWFASCRQEIIESYPNVFVQNTSDRKTNNYGWGGVIMQLSEGIVNLDAVSSQNYANALTYLSMLDEQRREAEANALKQSLK